MTVFLIIDGVEGYHIGASLKDAGKKCFGMNKIEGTDVVKDIMKKAQIKVAAQANINRTGK